MNRKCHYCTRHVFPISSANVLADRDCLATFDHVRPKALRGLKGVVACASCNHIKGSTPYEVFVAFMARDKSPDGLARRARYLDFQRDLMLEALRGRNLEIDRIEDGDTIMREDFLAEFRRAADRLLVHSTETKAT